MFYTFKQNNSGGSFDYDELSGISVNVIVEANSPSEANQLAQDIGLYFDGCNTNMDCPCCGDRWYDSAAYDGGDDVPSSYGKPLALSQDVDTSTSMKWMKGFEIFVHYADGRIVGYNS